MRTVVGCFLSFLFLPMAQRVAAFPTIPTTANTPATTPPTNLAVSGIVISQKQRLQDTYNWSSPVSISPLPLLTSCAPINRSARDVKLSSSVIMVVLIRIIFSACSASCEPGTVPITRLQCLTNRLPLISSTLRKYCSSVSRIHSEENCIVV